MKKEDLKLLIKPLIKECLKEVLIEEGFTKMLSEATKPSTNIQYIKAMKEEMVQQPSVQKKPIHQLQENRKKALDEIGNSGFDPFANSKPLREDKEIISSDPGVDISGLIGENKQIWRSTLDALKGKKAKE